MARMPKYAKTFTCIYNVLTSVANGEIFYRFFLQDGTQLTNLSYTLTATSAIPYGQNKTLGKLSEFKEQNKTKKE